MQIGIATQRFSAVMSAHNNMVMGLKFAEPIGNVVWMRIVIPLAPRVVLNMGVRERRDCVHICAIQMMN